MAYCKVVYNHTENVDILGIFMDVKRRLLGVNGNPLPIAGRLELLNLCPHSLANSVRELL